jgi:hypothetical protein
LKESQRGASFVTPGEPGLANADIKNVENQCFSFPFHPSQFHLTVHHANHSYWSEESEFPGSLVLKDRSLSRACETNSKESHQILGMYLALATSSELGKIARAKFAALLGIGRLDQERRRKHEHRFILGSLI